MASAARGKERAEEDFGGLCLSQGCRRQENPAQLVQDLNEGASPRSENRVGPTRDVEASRDEQQQEALVFKGQEEKIV